MPAGHRAQCTGHIADGKMWSKAQNIACVLTGIVVYCAWKNFRTKARLCAARRDLRAARVFVCAKKTDKFITCIRRRVIVGCACTACDEKRKGFKTHSTGAVSKRPFQSSRALCDRKVAIVWGQPMREGRKRTRKTELFSRLQVRRIAVCMRLRTGT